MTNCNHPLVIQTRLKYAGVKDKAPVIDISKAGYCKVGKSLEYPLEHIASFHLERTELFRCYMILHRSWARVFFPNSLSL